MKLQRRYGLTAQQTIELFSLPEPNSGCWLWIARCDPDGYGRIRKFIDGQGQGDVTTAHRVSFEAYKGPLPIGLQPDHKCRVRCCVNPEHLEAVTPLINKQRQSRTRPPVTEEHRAKIAAANLGKRSPMCRRGHPLTQTMSAGKQTVLANADYATTPIGEGAIMRRTHEGHL